MDDDHRGRDSHGLDHSESDVECKKKAAKRLAGI
jgi:hypothetical protein